MDYIIIANPAVLDMITYAYSEMCDVASDSRAGVASQTLIQHENMVTITTLMFKA